MGNKNSCLNISAEASVGPWDPFIDALSLSYSSASRCWGRGKRRLARFTFPHREWVCTQGEHMPWVQKCEGREVQYLPLDKLRRKDPSTPLRVKCSLRGEAVYAATVPLARLLGLLEEAVFGGMALLHFTLAGDEDYVAILSFTRPWYAEPGECSGWLRSYGGGDWEIVGQGDAACLGPRAGGSGALNSPGQLELGQGEAGPEPHQGVLPATSAQDTTVSEACCRGPPPGAEAREAVPQEDLGESSSLALHSDLHTTEPHVGVPPPSAKMHTVPGVHGEPSASARHAAVPESDLGESSSLACCRAIHHPAPAPGEGDPPAGAATREAVSDEEALQPAPSAQDASPPGLGGPWWHTVLQLFVVQLLVVCSFLILEALRR